MSKKCPTCKEPNRFPMNRHCPQCEFKSKSMSSSILKSTRLRSKKILDSAKGEKCQIRIPGICNHNPETTVACHLNGGGMGNKQSDIFIAYGCSDCHKFIDSGHLPCHKDNVIDFMEAVFRTQQILINKGLIKI